VYKLPALTIRDPFAALVWHKRKRYEWRRKSLLGKYAGRYILVHVEAAQTVSSTANKKVKQHAASVAAARRIAAEVGIPRTNLELPPTIPSHGFATAIQHCGATVFVPQRQCAKTVLRQHRTFVAKRNLDSRFFTHILAVHRLDNVSVSRGTLWVETTEVEEEKFPHSVDMRILEMSHADELEREQGARRKKKSNKKTRKG